MQHTDEIHYLLDEYQSLAESQENQRRLRCWHPEICARDQWHGQPRPDSFRKEHLVPIQIDVQHTFFTPLYPQDLAELYQSPESYLRFYLKKRIFAFQEFVDDTPLDGVIPIYMSSAFEPSLFGVPYHLFSDKEPMINQNQPVLRSRDDLDRLPSIDFWSSGMMPLAHRLYEGVKEIVGDRLIVVFPEWLRGSFGVALYLRGYQDFLVDLANDPEFSHSVMHRITQERKTWFESRSSYLGHPVPGSSLYNDEVDSGVIGKRHYRDHIMPYEQELARFHGQITYWHSCGNTSPMAQDVSRIGNIDLLDVSGWTDLAQVLPSINAQSQRMEIRFNPVKDLQDATPEQMTQQIHHKLELCQRYDVGAFTFRVSGMQPWKNAQSDIAQIQNWIEIARREVDRIG